MSKQTLSPQAQQALFDITQDIRRWDDVRSRRYARLAARSLKHRQEAMQEARECRQRGDTEGMRLNIESACEWHREYRETRAKYLT